MYEKLWLLKNVFFEKRSEINNIGMKAILEVVTQFKTKVKKLFCCQWPKIEISKKTEKKMGEIDWADNSFFLEWLEQFNDTETSMPRLLSIQSLR